MLSGIHLAIFAVLLVMAIPVFLWMRSTPASSSYRKALFTPPGRSFFGQLDMAVRSHYIVFPSVPVTSIISARRFTRGQALLSKFNRHTFDYVICDRKTMDVKCLISLNIKGKKHSKKIKSLKKLCKCVDLPLLEYEEKPYRNVPALRRQIFTTCGENEFDLPDNHERKHTPIAMHDDEAVYSITDREAAQAPREETEVAACEKNS